MAFSRDGHVLGYRYYLVPSRSEVATTDVIHGAVHPSSADCGGSENPGLSLASFRREPPIDDRIWLGFMGRVVGTVGFAGVLLGALAVALRRRGLGFPKGGWASWLTAFLMVTAADFFSNSVLTVLSVSCNIPLDWTSAMVFGSVFAAVGLVVAYLAFRLALRASPRTAPSAG
jgi:hypothetical protein